MRTTREALSQPDSIQCTLQSKEVRLNLLVLSNDAIRTRLVSSAGPHRLTLNSQATSVMRVRLYESAIAFCFEFSRKFVALQLATFATQSAISGLMQWSD